jgi:hypothetical protein
MACVPTAGFAEECEDGLGGVVQDSFLITGLSDIDKSTSVIAAGEITTLSQVALTNFYRYGIKKESANFVTTMTKENGNQVYETVVTVSLLKLSSAKNVELKLVSSSPTLIIVQDENGIYWAIGYDKGADLNGTVGQTGATMNEMNGYTLTFTARSGNAPYEVDPLVIAGLDIA